MIIGESVLSVKRAVQCCGTAYSDIRITDWLRRQMGIFNHAARNVTGISVSRSSIGGDVARRFKRQPFSTHASRRAIRRMKNCVVCGEEFIGRGEVCSTCTARLNPTIEISGICHLCGKPFDDHSLMYDPAPHVIPLCQESAHGA